MKRLFAIVYVLILVTQFPHVWAAYAAHEQEGIGHLTAAGAALGFELSTALFTYRIVTGSIRKWTRWGVRFFIAMSIVANLQYYGAFGGMVIAITPYVFAVALPVALALYAEEFGVEIRKEERKAAQLAPQLERNEAQEPQRAQSISRAAFLALIAAQPGRAVADIARERGVNKRTAQYWVKVARNGSKTTDGEN